MATVFLNGRFLDDAAQAGVSALDAGFQHGVGLFETMLGVRGRAEPVVLGLEHVRRLIDSAEALGLSGELREGAWYEAVVETFRRSGLERARVRLTVSGGDLNMLARDGGNGAPRVSDPTVLIVVQPATAYPTAMLEAGVLATIAGARANALNPFEGHKTLNYWWRLSELRIAAAKQAGEALVFGTANQLVGGCVSNVFLVLGGELHTPPARGDDGPRGATEADPLSAPIAPAAVAAAAAAPSAVLPGITRQWAMHTAEGRGVPTRRRALSVNELLAADEVFLTNSSWGVLPVVRVEAHRVGAGVPGPITRQLMADWVAETRPLA